MFMQSVVEAIWSEQSKQFAAHHRRALEMTPQQLVENLSRKRMEFVDQGNNKTNSNLLLTSGCSHRIKGKKLAGCSMCDYHSTNVEGWAMMRALRRKDVNLYSEVVRTSMTNVRGSSPKVAYCEQVTANDCMDPVEFPQPVLDALFGDDGVFGEEKPFCYLFEVLASNISRKRLQAFRDRFPGVRRLFFDFGVEATEWIREHWINKPCSDATIANALSILHEPGYFGVADMLIGIPGVTEEQSIEIFVDTVLRLEELGIDRIFALPLNRKAMTLQGFLYSELRNNARLTEYGLAQGEHTGVPWAFTILEALCRLEDYKPSVYKKLSVAATRPELVTVECVTPYNGASDCECNRQIIDALEAFQSRRDARILHRAREALKGHACHAQYRELRERQSVAGDLGSTLRLVSEEIAKTLFPEDWPRHMQGLDAELRSLPPRTVRPSQQQQSVAAI
jgi:uncharacterized Fe-S cluster-containing MiaB family protein